jgi:hypothetical protein
LVVNVSRSCVALAAVALALAGNLAAAEGLSLSKLNPFAGEEKPKAKPKAKSTANKTAGKESSWLKWPFSSTSSTAKKPAARKTKPEPSTLSKLNSGTKKLFSDTKNALTPGGKKPAAKSNSASGFAGRSTGSRTAKKEESKASGNIFASWFKPTEPEKPKRPERPSDWVGGERP